MGRIVSACNDLVFKKLFTDKENRNILRGFLSDVLDIEYDDIREIIVENSEITPEEIDQKFTRFDVRLTVNGKLINIEMQMHNYGDFKERSLYYWTQRYGAQLKKGESYKDIQTTISINVMNFNLFRHDDYRSFYTMADIEHREILTETCAMYFFELTKIKEGVGMEDKTKRWMQIIKAESEEELEELVTENESPFNECIMVLKRYNADDHMREMARRREERLREETSAIVYAENKGRIAGLTEGMSKGLAEGMSKGLAEGMTKGLAEGMTKERNNMLRMMRLSGFTEEQINTVLAQENNIE